MNRKAGIIVGAVVVLAVAGGLYAWNRSKKSEIDPNLKVMVNGKEVDPRTVEVKGLDGKPMDFTKTINPANAMGEMVDAYFALPKGAARNAHLDKMIDQQEQMKKMMSTDADGKVRINMAGAPTTGPAGEAKQTVMVRRSGGGGGNPLDSLPPELSGKMAEMMADLQKRRAERGLPPGPVGMMVMRSGSGNVTATPVAPPK